MEKNDWQTAIDVLDYAFQPIVKGLAEELRAGRI